MTALHRQRPSDLGLCVWCCCHIGTSFSARIRSQDIGHCSKMSFCELPLHQRLLYRLCITVSLVCSSSQHQQNSNHWDRNTCEHLSALFGQSINKLMVWVCQQAVCSSTAFCLLLGSQEKLMALYIAVRSPHTLHQQLVGFVSHIKEEIWLSDTWLFI